MEKICVLIKQTGNYLNHYVIQIIILTTKVSDIDKHAESLVSEIYNAARNSIRKSTGRNKGKIVPWWSEIGGKVIKIRNQAFKALKKSLNLKNCTGIP